MRGQLTLDALTASLLSALILLVLMSTAGIVRSYTLSHLSVAHRAYASVDRFVATLTSPSWVGANLTGQSLVFPGEFQLMWGEYPGQAPLRSGYREYLAVDAYKWSRYAGDPDAPIRTGNAVADLVLPRDDLAAEQRSARSMVVKSYRVMVVKTEGESVRSNVFPRVRWSGSSIDVWYPGGVPGVRAVWVTVSGSRLRDWVLSLRTRFDELVGQGMSEDDAYRELAREAVRVESNGNKIVFYSSTGWAAESPEDLVRKLLAEGPGSGLSLTVVALGGNPFLVRLSLPSPTGPGWEVPPIPVPSPGTVYWACGLFPVKLRAGVRLG